ncbi:hypothetical protein KBC04_00175 [Candidatus Babeliales bacterium]|nr:hypothetical protein [Candidatus Babeliales bacterium]MBP9843493.1 hypothetical protein [Candidatus Babeliales bacterium]
MHVLFMIMMMLYSSVVFASESGDRQPLMQAKDCSVINVLGEQLLIAAIEEAKDRLQGVKSMEGSYRGTCNNGNPFYARRNREYEAIAHTLFNAIDARRLGRNTYTREKVSAWTKCCVSMQNSFDCIDYSAIDSQVNRSGEKAAFSCDCGSGPISLGCSADCCGEYEKRKRTQRLLTLAFQEANRELGRPVTSIPEIIRS